MTPEQVTELSAAMLREHTEKMNKIGEHSLANCEQWASVTPKLAERFIETGDTVGKILEELKQEQELT